MPSALIETSSAEKSQRETSLREARLNAAQRIAKIGNWEWDIVNGGDWWSDELYRMLQVDPGSAVPSFELFLSLVHPQDRKRLNEATQRVLTHGGPHAIDVRVVLPDGTEKILHSQGEVEFGPDGEPLRMFGTLQDITERKAIETALRRSEMRYQEAQRLAKVGNWEWNVATGEQWWSDELYRIVEDDPLVHEPSFARFLDKVHPDDRTVLLDQDGNPHRAATSDEPFEIRLELAGGRRKIVELRVDSRVDEHGEPAVIAGTVRDVTERRELESRLRESEDRYASTVQLAAIGIAHIDADGRFTWANPQLCRMLGYSHDELLELTTKGVSHPEDVDVTDADRRRMHSGEIDSLFAEKRYVCRDGSIIWVRIASRLRRDEDGTPLYDISVVEDISDRKAAEARVQFLATHDEMTGLPNRARFTELLNGAIDKARTGGHRCAVLFIDLDRFKLINDSLGHESGDELVREMGRRLKGCMRGSDVVARLGGDEFVVLVEEIERADAATDIARKVLSAVLEPVEIASQECRVTASIGIAVYPDDAHDGSTLMKHADVAMYAAKEDGRNNFQLYSPEASPMSVERLALETHLGRALENNELYVQYQAQVDLTTGEIRGAEALLRWWNPALGRVPPAQFIPVAEDSGLIVPIGKWILNAACAQSMAWRRQGLPEIVMSVNLSPRQFKDPDMLDDLAEVLERTGMPPRLLQLEITESMIMGSEDLAAERVAALKSLGVRLAIDDFGIGYSSLSQLKRFPIDTLKIDRSFVRDIPENAEDMAITEAIISLGKILRVNVIAEGVETATQHEFLRERACDEMQGYYFSRPCHPDAFGRQLSGECRTETLLAMIEP